MTQDNNNYDNSNKDSKPVTVIVKRIAKKDKIKEFEEWLSGIAKEVSKMFRRYKSIFLFIMILYLWDIDGLINYPT